MRARGEVISIGVCFYVCECFFIVPFSKSLLSARCPVL